jgi:hypothetical protein
MASSILRNLKNKNVSGALNGNGSNNLFSQFAKFKNEILASGKDPQEMLNELLTSGKITQSQYNQAKRLAGLYRGKFGV